MPKIVVGLIKGRHELPVKEYIFDEIKDPSDIRTIEMTALQWVEEKCHVKKNYVSVNGGVSIRRKSAPITLVIYVTGLTVALTSVLKACALNGVRTVLMHYNSVTGEYVEQEMF